MLIISCVNSLLKELPTPSGTVLLDPCFVGQNLSTRSLAFGEYRKKTDSVGFCLFWLTHSLFFVLKGIMAMGATILGPIRQNTAKITKIKRQGGMIILSLLPTWQVVLMSKVAGKLNLLLFKSLPYATSHLFLQSSLAGGGVA